MLIPFGKCFPIASLGEKAQPESCASKTAFHTYNKRAKWYLLTFP